MLKTVVIGIAALAIATPAFAAKAKSNEPEHALPDVEAVRRAIDGVVMDADEMSVAGALNVELKAQSQFEARSKVRQRVLRRVLEESSMSDDQRLR